MKSLFMLTVVITTMENRWEKIHYTVAHRKAFREVEKQLFGHVSLRGWLHDLDKVILYPFLGTELTGKLHRKYSRHHCRAHTTSDYKQMIVDWECARFTKLDKPLNAYDTLYKYYIPLINKILPILHELGIDHPTKQAGIVQGQNSGFVICRCQFDSDCRLHHIRRTTTDDFTR